MLHRKITPKAVSEKVMDFLLWPVSLLAYCLCVMGLLNMVLWLWQILKVRMCGACGPCGM